MTNAEIASAPRWRIVLAGLTDAAIAGSVAWSLRGRRLAPTTEIVVRRR